MLSKPKIVNNIEELESFLFDSIWKSEFEVEKIKFSEQEQWKFQNGALSHVSGGFFDVILVEDIQSGDENISIFQPQSAITGLICHKQGSNIYLLLQARIEPGNSFVGQYGPTIQSTPANYLQLHGGKSTPYTNYFTNYSDEVVHLSNSVQLDLGKRYFQKNKIHCYVQSKSFLETKDNYIWADLKLIQKVLSMDNFLNADLRSLLVMFNWDSLHGVNRYKSTVPKEVVFQNSNLRASLLKVKPLNESKDILVLDEGIFHKRKKVGIAQYNTTAFGREVNSWSQPLFFAETQGLVILYINENSEKEKEVLITLAYEYGISHGSEILLPSEVVYPGEEHDIQINKNNIVSEFLQSDEGGRFFKNESRYLIVKTNLEIEIKENQRWLKISELRVLLNTSNFISFQLRCILSLISSLIYPNSYNEKSKYL